MRLVIGLGNPGAQYEHTRHNVGFRVVDMLATNYGWKWERRRRIMLASGTLGPEKVVLVKPLTYMNNSGEVVGELAHWYKLQPEDILVIYDELDLPIGKVRLRAKGSAGGHNGLDNIIRHVHTNQFPRLRVGIGRPVNHRMETINYVLGIPPTDERIVLEIAENRAVEAVPMIIQNGLEAAMNSINLDPEEQKKHEEKRRQKQERRQLALSDEKDRLDSQRDPNGADKPLES
ncbi:MAG TPA: aminoacyl-tRNA hydrolase [Ktedonobacteraceae bacterium]|nr:aminoacyl-tRNA hydrolase [Ktedonobacteraceae bacterium]